MFASVAISGTYVKYRFYCFKDGNFNVSDRLCSETPRKLETDDLAALFNENPSQTQELAEQLEVDQLNDLAKKSKKNRSFPGQGSQKVILLHDNVIVIMLLGLSKSSLTWAGKFFHTRRTHLTWCLRIAFILADAACFNQTALSKYDRERKMTQRFHCL